MKRTYFTCIVSLIFLFVGVSALAQNAEPTFNMGDRVEADIDFVSGNEDWRKATVTKVFGVLSGNGNSQKDSVIVALADTVAAQGSDSTIESKWLTELNIPYGKAEALKVKMISRTDKMIKSGNEAISTIYLVITDKRYVLYTRRTGVGIVSAVAFDESGTIVGGRIFLTSTGNSADLSLTARENFSVSFRFYWANQLLTDKIVAGGAWQGRMVGCLVKTDDGKTYLVPAKDLRPLSQQ